MSKSRALPEQPPIEPVTPGNTTDTHDRRNVEWILCVRDRKLKACIGGPGTSGAHNDRSAFDLSAFAFGVLQNHATHDRSNDGSTLDGFRRIADRAWRADATLLTAMLNAHAAIADYLADRVSTARGAPTRRAKSEAPTLEQHAQRAIADAVQILRARGARPEYLLVRFKELVATLPRNEYDVWEAVRYQTIRWVIEDYYQSP